MKCAITLLSFDDEIIISCIVPALTSPGTGSVPSCQFSQPPNGPPSSPSAQQPLDSSIIRAYTLPGANFSTESKCTVRINKSCSMFYSHVEKKLNTFLICPTIHVVFPDAGVSSECATLFAVWRMDDMRCDKLVRGRAGAE